MVGRRLRAGATRRKGASRKFISDARASSGGAGSRRGSSRWAQGLGPQLAQGVVAAPGQLACDRQRGAGVGEATSAQAQVVGVVGAPLAGRRLGRLIER